MKTPDEIKKGLERCGTAWGDHKSCDICPYVGWKCSPEMHDNALALIKRLEMMAKPNEQIRWERDIAIGQLKELGIGFGEKVSGQLSKWISVEERLPEEGQNVLVSVGRSIGISNIICHDMVTGEPIWTYTGLGTDPEYWMLLPEPPKEEEK